MIQNPGRRLTNDCVSLFLSGEWPGSRPLVDDATLDQNIHISLEQEEMSLVPDLNVGKCIQDGISREECFWQTHIDSITFRSF